MCDHPLYLNLTSFALQLMTYIINQAVKAAMQAEADINMIEQAYLKEYLTYQFKYQSHQLPAASQRYINFVESANADADILPAALLDRLAGREALYLLRWNRQEKGWLLSLKELASDTWANIKMALLPQTVVICKNTLYMHAGLELSLLSLDGFYQGFRTLPQGKVVAMNPCVVQCGEGIFEAGVSVVVFSEDRGYKIHHYSVNRVEKEQHFLLQMVTSILPKKYIQYRHFEVLVPNIMALVFLTQNQFCLFNLERGEIVPESRAKLLCSRLQGGESPIVRWREHIASEGFSKSLFLTIAVGSNIEIFFLYLKYLPEYQKNMDKMEGQKLKEKELQFQEKLVNTYLQDMHSGNFIHWEEAQWAPYLSLSAPGIVIDITISKKGVLYYSKSDPNAEIGNCNYLNLDSAFLQSPVLIQQATVWRRYYEDKQLSELSDCNRFFLPNRYPPEMVLALHNDQPDQLKPILLNTWRSNFRFRGIITYAQEMLIVRTGSLSLFRSIPEQLYRFEYFSEERLTLLQQIECLAARQGDVRNVFIKSDSEFEELIFHGESHRPISKERRYIVLGEEDNGDDEQAERRSDERFTAFTQELQQIMNEQLQSQYSSLTIPQLQMELALNQLYDKLSHYHLIANSKIFRIGLNVGLKVEQRQSTKQYELHACIIRVLNYFYELLHRSERHYLSFGSNLIALFLKQYRVSADIDRSVLFFLRMLMQNLFPTKITNYVNSQINPQDNYDHQLYSNPFIEFLIEKLQQDARQERAGDGEAAARVKMLREELRNIISIGFLDNHSIYFSRFWKNISIFKALVLSGGEQLAAYLSQYLLKQETNSFLQIYTQLREFISPLDYQTIENVLFFNQKLHSLILDPHTLALPLPTHSETELQRHPNEIGSLKQYIYASNKLNRSSANEKRDSREILHLIQEITEGEWQISFMSIKDKIDLITFIDDQQSLQFHEQALSQLIQLFNARTVIANWKSPEYQKNQAQFQLLNAKKEELKAYLNLIQHCFHKYKHQYEKIYEESPHVEREKESHQSELEQEHSFEMVLMKERFIDPEDFYFFGKGQGLICCTITIKLLHSALQSFEDSLEVKDNLIGFWLSSFPQGKQSEQALTLELLYLFHPEKVASYLKLDAETSRRIRNIYEGVKYEASYEFFNLFKENEQ